MIQVDIILITYNQEKYVNYAIDSILTQDLDANCSVRIIVADDASTDKTLTLIKNRISEFYDKGWTLFFLPSSSNLGHVHNYKRAFSKCNGDYVAILEGDDWWCSPNHLKRHVKYLQSHEECVGSSQFPLMFQEKNKLYVTPKILDYDSSKICIVDTKMEIRTNMIWNLSSFVVRTQSLKKLPNALFEVDLLDWPMYICLSTQGNIVLQTGYSSVYRINDNGFWSAGDADKKCQMLISTLNAAEQLVDVEYSDVFTQTINNLYPSQSFRKRICTKVKNFSKTKMNIICSTDSNYLTYCGVMLTSLLENNKDVDIYITIDNHFPDNKQHELLRLEKKYACNIHFVKIDGTLLNLCRTDCNEYISKATYYKMFAAQLLPITEDKVIYLDCDMIINGSLHELWNTDLSGYAMAGVPDIYNEADETYERLRYSKGKGYVNAGMLVINLKYWREHNVLQQCLAYIKQNKDNILWCEQDVLNALLHDYTLHLPLKFNYQIPMLMKCHYESFSHEQQQRIFAERRPVVLHYVSGIKPWMIEYYACPFFDEWQVYKRKSLWRMRFPILPQHNQLRALIKRYILWPLGWKRSNPYIIN